MRKWIGALSAFLLVLFLGFLCTRSCVQPKQSGGERPDVIVERGDVVLTVVETGTVEPRETVEVKSRVSGRIIRLYVEEGDRVKKGDLLAEIDPEELRLQAQRAEAQLRAAEAIVARIEENLRLTEGQVANALRQAQARYRRAKTEWETQPRLSEAMTEQARRRYETALRNRDLLVKVTHPQERVRLETERERAKAAYESDRYEYDRLKTLYEKGFVAKKEVERAESQLRSSEAQYRRVEDEWERLSARQEAERRNAEEEVALAKAALDEAVARAEVDKTKYEALQEAMAGLAQAEADTARVSMERKNLEQARAEAEQVRSQVADARRLLAETAVRAPREGIVIRKLVREGELVTALSSFTGGTPIVEIADLSVLQVKLEINEIDVAKLAVGTLADVEVDAFPEKKFRGRVTKISPASLRVPAAQDVVVKYSVEVTLEDSAREVKPGMSARCSMRVAERRKVLRVPLEYIGRDERGEYVMVKLGGGRQESPEKRYVKTGLKSPTYAEIVEGVEEGTRLEKPEFTGPRRVGAFEVRSSRDEGEGKK
jgi:HlyD family secretion protein